MKSAKVQMVIYTFCIFSSHSTP
uniref:Uncharacterized protein n=1 Tax=Arundo donax TaxID=35708 RepID=A0A0A9AUZ2_ARUDO